MQFLGRLIVATMLIMVVSTGIGIVVRNSELDKARRIALTELSYSKGCFDFAYFHCSTHVDNEKSRYECFQSGLDNCEKMALRYRKWLEK